MIEISVIVLSLLTEAYVILLIGVLTWLYFATRKKKRDRNAAVKLVDQIQHQSETRLTTTGSFLQEKYQLEGAELKKAIQSIDRAEKHFFQVVIDMYLKRDPEALGKLDASVAELVSAYKELRPAPAPREEIAEHDDTEKDNQIDQLKKMNEQLAQELSITNKKVTDMIGEFGNMFGGGKDNELEQNEVIAKVIAKHKTEASTAVVEPEAESSAATDALESGEAEEAEEAKEAKEAETDALDMADIAIEGVEAELDETQEASAEDQVSAEKAEHEELLDEVTSDSDIDDILNGIIESEPEKK